MTRKRLKADLNGDERLFKSFVTIAVFLLVLAGAFVYLKDMITLSSRADFEHLEGYEVFGGENYTLLNPESGYQVNWTDVTSKVQFDLQQNPYTEEGTEFTFWWNEADERERLQTFVVRNNSDWYDWSPLDWMYESVREVWKYKDEIFIMTRGESWLDPAYSQAISFEAIIDGQMSGSNVSRVAFGLGDWNLWLFVNATIGQYGNFSNAIWANSFHMWVGTLDKSDNLAEISMWILLGQVATASLPDTEPFINLILAATFWAAVGFMSFTIISRIVPFISGG